jgi:hypothetical protein
MERHIAHLADTATPARRTLAKQAGDQALVLPDATGNRFTVADLLEGAGHRRDVLSWRLVLL